MKRKWPYSPGTDPGEVVHVAESADAKKLARQYAVPFSTMRAWLTGDEPMPRMLFELLAMSVRCELPSTAGMFAGWRVLRGERFTGPNIEHGGLHWTDIDRLPEFRMADKLANRQADLIDRLTRERDFYQRQCELESKYAVMLRLMVDGPPNRRPPPKSYADT